MKERLKQWWTLAQWRLEAWRTGDSFAAVARRRSLVYQVEQLFLIDRQTDRWLLHVAADPAIAEDAAQVETTVRDIQRLARDHLLIGNEPGMAKFRLGDAQIWIAPGLHSYLAALIRGDPPSELRTMLEEAIAHIDVDDPGAVDEFRSDASALEAAGVELTACLRSEHKPIPDSPHLRHLWVLTAAAAAVILALALLDFRSELRWRDFLARLKSEPGILVAAAERHWFTPSRVVGLRDPLARDPSVIASEAKLNPARIRFEWKEYAADDPAIVQRRVRQDFAQYPGVDAMLRPDSVASADSPGALEQFTATFTPPPTVQSTVVNNTLVLTGAAPYEWVATVQEGATRIPGISAINGDDLVVEFDQDLVLQRFRDEFGMPETVDASLRKGRLILSGEAPHAWIDRVRRDALRVAGIRAIDHRKLEDMDQRAFQQAKFTLEDATIVFVLNRDSLPPGAEVELGRLTAEARRCFAAAENLGVNISLEVQAYGDAIATDAENAELSRRRAEAVRKFLGAGGADERKITPAGMGTPPPPAPGEKSGAGKFDRRVSFRVLIQP